MPCERFDERYELATMFSDTRQIHARRDQEKRRLLERKRDTVMIFGAILAAA
jgi:hypothetical protein